jgi:hypothetical protein
MRIFTAITFAILASPAFAQGQAQSITASQLALQICQSITQMSQAIDKGEAINRDLVNQVTALKEKCGKACESDSKKQLSIPAQP